MWECVYKRTLAADTSVSHMNTFTFATEVWDRRSLQSCKRQVSLLDDSGNLSAHAEMNSSCSSTWLFGYIQARAHA